MVDIDRRGSSWTDVIDRAGVSDKLDRLRPLNANAELLLDFFLEWLLDSTINHIKSNNKT